MVGITCKKCANNEVENNINDRSNSDMVIVEKTERNGSEVVTRDCNKIQHKRKPKNQS